MRDETSQLRLLFLAVAAIGLAGCMGGNGALHSLNDVEPTGDVRLSDAKPLDDLETDDDVQITFTDKLSPPQTDLQVYFGEADAFDSDDDDTPAASVPVIALHLGSQWKGVSLASPGSGDAGWRYVGAGPAPREVWGVLDTSAGDSQPDFVVAHSTDGALSFSLNEFHKPARLAQVSDFAMSRSGRGRVTLSLDTDCGSVKAGLYHYETTDDGKNWSKVARYEPDAMIRADTVPDDEQPAPEPSPIRTLFFARHPSAAHRARPQLLTPRLTPRSNR